MRVALVTAAFRGRSPIDLASHIRSLAPALARAGASVEVFAGTTGSGLAPYAQRRTEFVEPVTGQAFGVTAIELEPDPDQDRVAESFAAFLERERPRVCHFEQLDPMGVGLVREAKQRRISTLYSAHDTWPAHDRTSLTLPDLSPFELGDTEAEARSLAAERILGQAGLQYGDAAYGERLPHLLHGELVDPGEAAVLRESREAIELRRAQKRVALSGVDRRFAASRLLSRELSAAVGRAFTFRAPGVDKAVVAASQDAAAQSGMRVGAAVDTDGPSGAGRPAPLERAKGPLRAVFLGTTTPTSGLDVLLDAVSAIRADGSAPAISLRLGLERTDDVRDAQIHARAQLLRLDVAWTRGASVDALAAIAGADLLVLPTVWGEVAPSALRLALAAGVPAVASRMPGVVEAAPSTACVLVTPGSVESLTEALTRLASQDGAAALKSMRSAALSEQEANTKSVDHEAVEWMDTYRALVESADALERARLRRRSGASGEGVDVDSIAGQQPFGAEAPPEPKRPAALVEVEEQIAELRGLSNAELFARAQSGVAMLRQAFGLKDTDAELLARVVSRGGMLRDRAEHDGATRREVARALGELKVAQEAVRSEETVRSKRIADLQTVLEQYEHEVKARADEAAAATAAAEAATAAAEVAAQGRAEAVGLKETAEQEASLAQERLAQAESEAKAAVAESKREAESLRGQVGDLQGTLEEVQGALDAAKSEADEAAQAAASGAETAEEAVRASEAARARAAEDAAEAESRYREVAVQVEAAKSALESAETARDKLARSIDERAAEVRSLRARLVKPTDEEGSDGTNADGAADQVGDLESIEAYCVSMERDLEALRRNDERVAGEAKQLMESIATAAKDNDEESEASSAALEELDRVGAQLAHVTTELGWRQREMEGAIEAAKGVRARFLAGPLASRLRSWGQPPEDVVVSMTALAEVSSRSELGSDGGAGEQTRPLSETLDRGAAVESAAKPEQTEDPAAPLPSVGSSDASPSSESEEVVQSKQDGEVKS